MGWASNGRIAGVGMGALRVHARHVPELPQSLSNDADAAPTAGARECTRCIIGAPLQGLGAYRRTRRSQSVCNGHSLLQQGLKLFLGMSTILWSPLKTLEGGAVPKCFISLGTGRLTEAYMHPYGYFDTC